jgi:predicted Zn-dependent protease
LSKSKLRDGQQFEADRGRKACLGSSDGDLNVMTKGRPRFGVRSQGDYNTRFQAMTQPQKKTRRQLLEEFVAAKPNDAFARYGLAMECANSGDAGAADQQFKTLLGAHPDYVAAYFQYGQYLARAGRTEEARSTLTQGIATAQRTGDDHARSEMEAALGELG